MEKKCRFLDVRVQAGRQWPTWPQSCLWQPALWQQPHRPQPQNPKRNKCVHSGEPAALASRLGRKADPTRVSDGTKTLRNPTGRRSQSAEAEKKDEPMADASAAAGGEEAAAAAGAEAGAAPMETEKPEVLSQTMASYIQGRTARV